MMDNVKNSIKMISFNCKSVTRSEEFIRRVCREADIIALQETWLLPHDIPALGNIDPDFGFSGKSAVDTSAGILRGRPLRGRRNIVAEKYIHRCVPDTVQQCTHNGYSNKLSGPVFAGVFRLHAD